MRIVRSGLAAIVLLSCGSIALAQEVAPATRPVDALFEASIERRAGETVAAMKLDDAKAARVKERFKQHFRDIDSWDQAHGDDRAAAEKLSKAAPADADAKAKLDAMNAQLQSMQARFFADVGADLTPEQIEAVKNRLVGGRYEHNIQGYKVEYPDLPADAWQHVEQMWRQARDEAMPLGTSSAKSDVFERWKGRVNNWLSKQGFVGKSAAAKKAKAATQAAK